MRCRLRPSRHAKDKMIEWGFSKETIIDAILRGPKRLSSEGRIEIDFKGLRVVYKQFPCTYFVITIHWRYR